MIENKNARSYEVSIWTLQDDFISVLKRSNLEQKGSIENAEMTLKNDGENNFSFRIPMYIKQNGEFIENPIWYNVENGVLITSLRKLKVIFNKTSGTKEEKKLAGEAVFEFVITKVTESHEGYEKYCEVESEGLAFHELGKQGYSITLSGQDDVLVDFDGVPFENNINYWVEKVLGKPDDDPSPAWTYEIQMDWNKYDDRDSDKIYEEEYISDWSSAGVPIEVESAREKYELIEMSESNKYNLLQTIAEKFQVYTKYVYEYDDNYHIVGRKVIFYNNFLQEDEGFLDFTYKYDTTNISREMDGTDTITKMFVKDLNDAYSPSGVASISDTTANKSRENYLLNFDYLYEIGAISQEQYDEVSVFETQIGSINRKINNLNKRILSRELQLPELEAKRDTLNGNAEAGTTGVIQQCEENIEQSSALLLALTDGDGLIEITAAAPKILYVRTHKDSGTELRYGITTAPFGGIKISTLKLFKNADCSEEITSFRCKTDNDGNLKTISGLPTNLTNNVCYATFSYEPKLEYENVINSYTRRLNSAKKKYNVLVKKIDKINKELDGDPDGATEAARNGLKKRLENQLAKKAKKLKEFEKLMGPALREGTWQPEDDYADCGEKEHFGISGNKVLKLLRNQNVEESSSSNDNEDDDSSRVSINIGWSEYREDFDEEPAFYEYGPTLLEKRYLCIDLRAKSRNGHPIYSTLYYRVKENPNFLNEMSLIYTDSDEKEISGTENKINYWRYLTMGSGIEFAFLAKKSNGHLLIDNENSVIPVLMITDLTANSKELLDTNNHTKDYKVKNYARLGIVETVMEDNELKIRIKENTGIYFYGTRENNTVVDVNDIFIEPSDTYTRVYPRIKVSSRYLKASEDTLKINLYDNLYENSSSVDEGDETTSAADNNIITLQENYDYYIRNDIDDYYITLKPEQIIKFGKNIFTPKDRNLKKTGQIFPADFIFSNTSLAVYLDAREIMKENSYPKTSYSITPSVIKEDFYKTAYNRLNQLIHINDPELKFKNVMGYITELTLNLENPDEDKIVVKNYKTKFEDLFSTIVAQTETMKKNTYLLDRVANGFNSQGGLSDEVLEDIMRRLDELSAPINTYRAAIGPVVAYENYKPIIDKELNAISSLIDETVDEITSSLTDLSNNINENAAILTSYIDNAVENKVYIAYYNKPGITNYQRYYNNNPITTSNDDFKMGDILKILDNSNNVLKTYIATIDNDKIDYTINENRFSSFKGWSLVKDGTLAAIQGANLDINADAGTIVLSGQNNVSIASGSNLDLQANADILIQANNTVNIGGSDINIYQYSDFSSASDIEKGVLISSSSESSSLVETSYIDIKPSKLTINNNEGIALISANNSSGSIIEISRNNGIKLLSDKTISLFSTDNNSSSANVLIAPSRILMGVVNNNSGSVMDINSSRLAFGTGVTTSATLDNIGKINNNGQFGISGVYISQSEIRLAAKNIQSNNGSFFQLNGNGIVMGAIINNQQDTSGNYITLTNLGNNPGICIGVKPTNNGNDTIANRLTSSNYAGAKFQVYAPNFIVDENGHMYANGADIAGKITANDGQIGGWGITTNYLRKITDELTIEGSEPIEKRQYNIGLFSNPFSSDPAISNNSNNYYNPAFYIRYTTNLDTLTHYTFYVRSNGHLYATSADISGKITATSGQIGSWKITGNGLFSDIITITENNTTSYYRHRFSANSNDNVVLSIYGPCDANGNNHHPTQAPFYINRKGELHASNATIKGTITVSEGSIGSWSVDRDTKTGAAGLTSSNGFIKINSTNKISSFLDENSFKLTNGNNSFSITASSTDVYPASINPKTVPCVLSNIPFFIDFFNSNTDLNDGLDIYRHLLNYSVSSKDINNNNITCGSGLQITGSRVLLRSGKEGNIPLHSICNPIPHNSDMGELILDSGRIIIRGDSIFLKARSGNVTNAGALYRLWITGYNTTPDYMINDFKNVLGTIKIQVPSNYESGDCLVKFIKNTIYNDSNNLNSIYG